MSGIDSEESYRRDCLARYWLERKPRGWIRGWLQKQGEGFREDMRERLNRIDNKRRGSQ